MTQQASWPLSPPPGWTKLAQEDEPGTSISRCPAGHIHVEHGSLTVQLTVGEFFALARLVAEAASHLGRKPEASASPHGPDRGSLIVWN